MLQGGNNLLGSTIGSPFQIITNVECDGGKILEMICHVKDTIPIKRRKTNSN